MNLFLILTIISILIFIIISCIFYKKYKYYNERKTIEDIKDFYKKVYIKKSSLGGEYGRGIFASQNIQKNEIIDVSPYIEDDKNNIKGILWNYVFYNKEYPNKRYIGFGLSPLYNYSDNNNADYFIDEIHNLIVIKSKKDINKDEEILIPYSNDFIGRKMYY